MSFCETPDGIVSGRAELEMAYVRCAREDIGDALG